MAMPPSDRPVVTKGQDLWPVGLWSSATAMGRRLIDLVLPPRCPSCGADVEQAGLICSSCWAELRILAPPWCDCCGRVFASLEAGNGTICGECLQEPPIYDHARAAFAYSGAARKLVLSLKHGDRLHVAPQLSDWLYRALQGLPPLEDDTQPRLVVPVPLHWRRLLTRKYNQAAELARALVKAHGDQAGLVYAPHLVKRKRATPPQGSKQAPSRHLNVRAAFELVNPKAVQGANIVLIDDVITTGATVNELAKVLKRAGAARVDVVAVTRVLDDG